MQSALPSVDDVLDFWFGPLDDAGLAQASFVAQWWTKDANFDAQLRRQFGALHAAASTSGLPEWASDPKSDLARIIVFDQFSRNLYRNTPQMVEQDGVALGLAKQLVASGADRGLPTAWRSFVYMPYEHSEDINDQETCIELFKGLHEEAQGKAKDFVGNSLEFAIKHLEIIQRFGRFPHRNEFLGRESTPEEIAFLQQPGSSF